MNRKGFEFSFAWLFAIIVGAIIIFLAIFAVGKLIGTGGGYVSAATCKQITIIFEPLETELASGKKPARVNLKEETKIYNECFEGGNFGIHKFSCAIKSGFKGWSERWPDPGMSVPNKYVFSNGEEEGKTIYFFSKPFEMPWKVSEIIFLTTEKYCFVDAPEEVEDEVLELELENIIKLNNCSLNDIKVCFSSGSNCEIIVRGKCSGGILECESEYDYGFVEKNGKSLSYDGSLMYAAIFSSPKIYECNVKRLMKRLSQQALLFKDEADFLSVKCGTLPSSGLLQLVGVARNLKNSQDLLLVRQVAKQVNEQNEAAECKLW